MECRQFNKNEVIRPSNKRNHVCTVKLTQDERLLLDRIQEVAMLDSTSDVLRIAVRELWADIGGGKDG